MVKIDGENYNAIMFSNPQYYEKLVAGTKQQNIKCNVIPSCREEEEVAIMWKVEGKKKLLLYMATITEIEPKKIMDISEEDAKAEGFENQEECIDLICKLYKVIPENFCFIIRFKKKRNLMDWL